MTWWLASLAGLLLLSGSGLVITYVTQHFALLNAINRTLPAGRQIPLTNKRLSDQ